MPVAQGQAGVRQEMHKFKTGDLHSGSKHGPIVKNRKQAIAIAMHEAGLSKGRGAGGLRHHASGKFHGPNHGWKGGHSHQGKG